MTSKDLRILFITTFGLTLVVIFLILINQIDISQGISLLITSILVLITAIYVRRTGNIADETKKQAEASLKMAEEMRRNRYDTVKPVIDIYRDTLKLNNEDRTQELVSAKSGDISAGLVCFFKNIGLGPAIDAYSYVQVSGRSKRENIGTLAVGEATFQKKLSMVHEYNKDHPEGLLLVVIYKDIYDRGFVSTRNVLLKNESWEIGPLQISQIKKKNYD